MRIFAGCAMKHCFHPLYSLRSCLFASLRPLTALVAGSLFLLAGCGDKHEPTKPTVAAVVVVNTPPPAS